MAPSAPVSSSPSKKQPGRPRRPTTTSRPPSAASTCEHSAHACPSTKLPRRQRQPRRCVLVWMHRGLGGQPDVLASKSAQSAYGQRSKEVNIEVGPLKARTSEQRFFEKCASTRPNECWLWTGSIMNGGYARFGDNGRNHLAHRWAYTHFVGPIPEGKEIDHVCRVRHCVNPAHLEAVTPQVNTLRSNSPSAKNGRQAFCVHGHAFTAANTKLVEHRPNRWRRLCRACMRRNTSLYRERKKNNR